MSAFKPIHAVFETESLHVALAVLELTVDHVSLNNTGVIGVQWDT